MDSAREPFLQISPSTWIGNGAAGSRRSWPSCIRETRRPSCLRLPTTSSEPTRFWPQHRPNNEREYPQRMEVARAVAHEPPRPSQREERSSGKRPRGVASANASRGRNLRTTCRGSRPWNQPKLCLHQRLRRQYILHLFAHDDVVASRIRAHIMFPVVQ